MTNSSPLPKLGFIGAGNMASSLISGLIAKGHKPSAIIASSRHEATLAPLEARFGIVTSQDNHVVARAAHILLLAVKPQVLKDVLTDLSPTLKISKPLIISVAAGISIHSMQTWIGENLPIVRCMPNTPSQIMMGASGLFASETASAKQRAQAQAVLEAVGLAVWLDTEAQMDTVTAVSGSGPAYFFLLMEAIINAGIELGLSPAVARALTLQTALGAAQMAATADIDPAELRLRVTSRGGTTERAIAHLENRHMREIISGALHAAAERSKELAAVLV